ncbi:MAG: hypothetical protein AAF388_14085 [Bacteroidota bacterium]
MLYPFDRSFWILRKYFSVEEIDEIEKDDLSYSKDVQTLKKSFKSSLDSLGVTLRQSNPELHKQIIEFVG